MAKPRFNISGHPSEDTIQTALIEWVRYNPKIKNIVFHVPNGGSRTASEGAKLKRMGVLAGVSDIFIMRARHGFNGGFIELKTIGGKISPEQKSFLKSAEDEGYFTAVTWTLDEALEVVGWYLFDD